MKFRHSSHGAWLAVLPELEWPVHVDEAGRRVAAGLVRKAQRDVDADVVGRCVSAVRRHSHRGRARDPAGGENDRCGHRVSRQDLVRDLDAVQPAGDVDERDTPPGGGVQQTVVAIVDGHQDRVRKRVDADERIVVRDVGPHPARGTVEPGRRLEAGHGVPLPGQARGAGKLTGPLRRTAPAL